MATFSPKNLLVPPDGDVLLVDHEVAHWGHPAFDVSFVTNHLCLKAIRFRAEGRADAYLDAAATLLDAYATGGAPPRARGRAVREPDHRRAPARARRREVARRVPDRRARSGARPRAGSRCPARSPGGPVGCPRPRTGGDRRCLICASNGSSRARSSIRAAAPPSRRTWCSRAAPSVVHRCRPAPRPGRTRRSSSATGTPPDIEVAASGPPSRTPRTSSGRPSVAWPRMRRTRSIAA